MGIRAILRRPRMRALRRGGPVGAARLLAGVLPALILLSAGALPAVAASDADAGVDLKYMYYQDRNGVWNHTPALSFFRRLGGFLKLTWNQEIDAVSGASRRLGLRNVGRLGGHDSTLDGISGASRREIRHSEQAGLAYEKDGRVLGASFYFSDENDYTSYSPAVTAAWDFAGRNTTLSGSYALFRDDFHPTGPFAGLGGDRRIQSLSVSLAQVFTPLSLGSVTVNPILSSGYLGHPYNPVVTGTGALVAEELPDRKQSWAFAGRWVQGYRAGGRLGAVHLEARHYRDSWSLVSNTLDAQWYHYVTDGAYVRLRARGYRQGAAGFWKEAYAGDETYRTADIRFSAFSSLTLGVKLAAAFPEGWAESAWLPDRWDLSYDHGFRDTKGDGDGVRPYTNYQLYGQDEYYMQGTLMAGLGFDF